MNSQGVVLSAEAIHQVCESVQSASVLGNSRICNRSFRQPGLCIPELGDVVDSMIPDEQPPSGSQGLQWKMLSWAGYSGMLQHALAAHD